MKGATSLPWKKLLLVYSCRFVEPLSYNLHLPYIYFMIRDFNVTREENIGYYCGLLVSVMAMAQIMAVLPLGSLSDRVGRKPVILFGLTTIGLCLLLFGLGKSIAWLLTIKLMSGLLNGNTGILKSMVAEMTKDHSTPQRTQAFLYLQMTYVLGNALSAILGGYLSEPVTKYPNLFKEGTPIAHFLKEYPYFLPGFVGFVITATVWLSFLLFMEETLPKNMRKNNILKQEEMPLLQHEGGNSVDKRSMREIMTTTLIFIITVYTLGALHVQCYEALFPTWASTPANQGGLGFTSTEIGTLMSISNTAMLFTQLVVLPRLTKRWSMTRIIQCLLASCLIMSFVIGLWRFPLLHNDSMWISVGLLLCMIIQSVGQNITLTLSGILINTSVKHPNTLGFVNGIAQSCSSTSRMIGPMITGLIWSSTLTMTWIPLDFRSYINWIVLGLVGLITFLVSVVAAYMSQPQ